MVSESQVYLLKKYGFYVFHLLKKKKKKQKKICCQGMPCENVSIVMPFDKWLEKKTNIAGGIEKVTIIIIYSQF